MTRKNKRPPTFTFVVSDETRAALQAIGKAELRPEGFLIRQALDEFLKRRSLAASNGEPVKL
jgi:predicted transcriptional regulator